MAADANAFDASRLVPKGDEMIADETRSNPLAAGCSVAAIAALLFVAQASTARADDADAIPFLNLGAVGAPCDEPSNEVKELLREIEFAGPNITPQQQEAHAESDELEAQHLRAAAKAMDCEHKLSGSKECIGAQQRLYNEADSREEIARFLRKQIVEERTLAEQLAKARADLDACLKREAAKKSPPTPSDQAKKDTPPTPPPPAPPTVVLGPPAGTPPAPLPPVALGPSNAITPPATSGTLTCYYTDAAGQQKTSFTTSDPEVIKNGCPPNIFPGLILVTAPPSGVSGPLVPPPMPVSPPPSGPVASGPPPSAGADTCDIARQRLAWIDAQLAQLQGNSIDRAWRTDLETQKVQTSAMLKRNCDSNTAAAGSSPDPSSGLASNPGGSSSTVDPLPPVDIATLLGGVTTVPPSAPLPPITVNAPPVTPSPPKTAGSPQGCTSMPPGWTYCAYTDKAGIPHCQYTDTPTPNQAVVNVLTRDCKKLGGVMKVEPMHHADMAPAPRAHVASAPPPHASPPALPPIHGSPNPPPAQQSPMPHPPTSTPTSPPTHTPATAAAPRTSEPKVASAPTHPAAPASRAGCHTDAASAKSLLNESSSAKQTTSMGTACTVKFHSGLDSPHTAVEVQPSHGSLSRVGNLAWKYQPAQDYKGSDTYRIKLCATQSKTGRSGCAHVTYQVTIN